MYTGTLVNDLMAIVERAMARAEQQAEEQHIAEELHEIFSLQISLTPNDSALAGAA